MKISKCYIKETFSGCNQYEYPKKPNIFWVERESTNFSLVNFALPVQPVCTVRSRVNLIISSPPGNLLNLVMFISCVAVAQFTGGNDQDFHVKL